MAIGLIIIGDEMWKQPQVRRMVIQTRMEPYVRFFGFVPFDTLRVFYSAATVFVFPLFFEAFAIPPLDPMASGPPSGRGHRRAETPPAGGQGLAQVDEFVNQRITLAKQARNFDRIAKNIANIGQTAQNSFTAWKLAE